MEDKAIENFFFCRPFALSPSLSEGSTAGSEGSLLPDSLPFLSSFSFIRKLVTTFEELELRTARGRRT